MQAQQWTDILKLLAMMVIGNKDTLSKERDMFAKAAVSLRNAVYPGLNLTQEMAGEWLDIHREEMNRSMSSVYFDETLNALLKNLSAVSDKRTLIVTMLKMTVSEGERSENENRVIGGMNTVWGNPRPVAMVG